MDSKKCAGMTTGDKIVLCENRPTKQPRALSKFARHRWVGVDGGWRLRMLLSLQGGSTRRSRIGRLPVQAGSRSFWNSVGQMVARSSTTLVADRYGPPRISRVGMSGVQLYDSPRRACASDLAAYGEARRTRARAKLGGGVEELQRKPTLSARRSPRFAF